MKSETHIPIQRALISVSDKTGIENFARALTQAGVELLSTGGTYGALKKAGIAVREVSDYTGFPEMMDGRVKTLHPKIHGGILALRDVAAHTGAMSEHAIQGIDLVVVNLYPFEATIKKRGVTREEAIENIDIGGPSMVRSAAKNQRFVGVVTDPADYGRVLDEMQKHAGGLSLTFKRELALKAFALTARYDAAISAWLFETEAQHAQPDASPFPESCALVGRKVADLRYGENPHQKAAFYGLDACGEPALASARILNGKTLSYNNLVDLDAALALAKEFDEPFVAVLKHNNPCGAALAPDVAAALEHAWDGDPVSAFGSVLAFTRTVDLRSAEYLVSGNRFVEAIVAPGFDDDAFKLLTEKPKWGKSVRLLAVGDFGSASRDARDLEVKKLVGGFLVQERDLRAAGEGDCKVATKRAPTDEELVGLLFANRIAKHVKSNAIVLTQGTRVRGVGAGQMSRVDSVHIALRKAGVHARGCVLGSDAFFPFPDGVELALEAGVTAILQPGGSVRDSEVIAACDKHGAAMVFTGTRHFRH
ncbi:MAG: bifunctional phosphoribosylaminoimidazolecarboxamide formyltransferase/IMP cyclohydrolase [Planctomycetes bacterium]|nr:bifunctional phosphoribosylaminoimidazolecarboxamide formyltransferase/IMP cyclohydrolase [Planctomycetota bacterium]